MFLKEGAVFCAKCGRPIVFVRTEHGKKMPCEQDTVPYIEDPNGDKLILTKSGKTVRGRIVERTKGSIGSPAQWVLTERGGADRLGSVGAGGDATIAVACSSVGWGHVPHWGQCAVKPETTKRLEAYRRQAEERRRKDKLASELPHALVRGSEGSGICTDAPPAYEQTSLFGQGMDRRSYKHPE